MWKKPIPLVANFSEFNLVRKTTMNKTLKLLPLFFFAHQAQAAVQVGPASYPIQINFSGEYIPATVNTAALNNQTFNGQFNFDFLGGEYGSRGPSGSGKDNGRVELEYEDNATASVSFSGQTYNVDQIELSFFDDYKRLEEQDDIDEHGFTGLFDTGIYDAFFLDGYLSTNQEQNHDLTNGLEVSIVYLFNKDQFSFDEIDGFAANLNPYNLPYNPATDSAPVFKGFEFNQVNNGAVVQHGTGPLSDINVSTVPVPTAFWLFGSACIGLIARKRSRS